MCNIKEKVCNELSDSKSRFWRMMNSTISPTVLVKGRDTSDGSTQSWPK